MTNRFGGEPVAARIGDCLCPGTPHPGGDVVYLLPRLTYEGGVEANAVLSHHVRSLVSSIVHEGEDSTAHDDAERRFSAELVECYLRHQVSGWNISNGTGEDVPYDPDLLLTDYETARLVGEAADDLYSGALFAPLVATVSTSSQRGQTGASTSARKASTARPRKP